MEFAGKATKLQIFTSGFPFLNFKTPQMRAFWITAFAFFMCFFSWFGIVPFMPQVVKDLGLTPQQKYMSIIVAVSGTVFARLLLGKLCDRFGPRLCYTWLLLIGAIPVIAIAFVQNYTQFLICRLFIGFIGASFVITQYHTSIMFAPNCVGTANATSAGWGNLGGGANRIGMMAISSFIVSIGLCDAASSWRWSMAIAGIICALTALIYFFFTQDAPEGNFKDLRAAGKMPEPKKAEAGFMAAAKDYRVWILFLVYAGCFGIELTVYGVMDDYLQNAFSIERSTAMTMVACFALMNIFARTLGGVFGDKFGIKNGLKGRVQFLTIIMCIEGIVLCLFSQISLFPLAFAVLILFSLSVQMAEGATFTVVPFINKKCIGSVAGIVGAGGNVGAVLAGLLIKSNVGTAKGAAESAAVSNSFLIIGAIVILSGILSLLIKFSPEAEAEVREATLSSAGKKATEAAA